MKTNGTDAQRVRHVAVVIPTCQRAELLTATLRSLALVDPAPQQVVVVNDGSTDETDAVIRAFGVRGLRTDHGGAAVARNAGWRSLMVDAEPPDVVAFIDDDCVADPGWLAALIAPFDDPSVGLVQGCTVPSGPRRPTDRSIEVTAERGLYESCNIAYRREALEEVGGFDESFGRRFTGRPFGEDTDLAWRVRRAGWQTAFASHAVVRHYVFPGTWRTVLREEWRRGLFPWLVGQIPELRDELPAGRWFLRRQS